MKERKFFKGVYKIAIEKRCFNLKCTTNHLVAGLRPNPLRELTVLPPTLYLD